MALQVASPDITDKAKKAEHEGDLKLASTLYEQALKKYPIDEFSYNRLMIVYRKLKQYKDELRVIKKGIKDFEAAYNKRFKKHSEKTALQES